jgi:hypothetical protein
MKVASTIESYTFNGSNFLQPNSWGWQVNGAVTNNSFDFDWFQMVQFAEPVDGAPGDDANIQIWPQGGLGLTFYPATFAVVPDYLGAGGGFAYDAMNVNSQNELNSTGFLLQTPSGAQPIDMLYPIPHYYNQSGKMYSMWSPVANYQNVLVAPSGSKPTDFYSGNALFESAAGFDIDDQNCLAIFSGEDSNIVYQNPVSCNSIQCNQTITVPLGYAGNSNTGKFNVAIQGGWGTNGNGVDAGDLLIATEAVAAGSVSFSPTGHSINDTLGNTWTPVGGVGGPGYCTANDCVEMWYAVAKGNAGTASPDTVTFWSSDKSQYTYGFVREFVGYNGTVDTRNHNSGTTGKPNAGTLTMKDYANGDLIVAVAADIAGGWNPGSSYYMIGASTSWQTASEFSPGWTTKTTTAPWSAPSTGKWAEIAVAFAPLTTT